MLKRSGEIHVKRTLFMMFSLIISFFSAFNVSAIAIDSLTFSLPANESFVAKRIINNNRTPRLYRVSVVAVDRPSENEVQSRPADGDLLFSPRQLMLQSGESDYFKFYYHGKKDEIERYYRISFHEIPTHQDEATVPKNKGISMAPVIILDAIMVVRPRHEHFVWSYNPKSGTVINQGNTWFKLLIKPGCETTEQQGDAIYMRAGDKVTEPGLRQPGNHYILYNEAFIPLSDDCH